MTLQQLQAKAELQQQRGKDCEDARSRADAREKEFSEEQGLSISELHNEFHRRRDQVGINIHEWSNARAMQISCNALPRQCTIA